MDYIVSLSPSLTTFGDRAFKKVNKSDPNPIGPVSYEKKKHVYTAGRGLTRNHPASTLIWDHQPPGLRENKLLLFTSPSLCCSLIAAQADEYTSISHTYLNTEHSGPKAHGNISESAQKLLPGAVQRTGLQVPPRTLAANTRAFTG